MSVGMYIVPAITLPRAFGSLIFLLGRKRFGIESMCSATGLIFGQGIFGDVALILDVLSLPGGQNHLHSSRQCQNIFELR